MPRKTQIAAAIARAQHSLRQQVFAAAMAEIPGHTPMGELVGSLRKEGFANDFSAMSVADFVAAVSGSVAAAAPRRGRKPGRKPGRKAGGKATKSTAGRGKSFNTRTEAGRAALDQAIAAVLSAAGSARAEAIRAEVGASPPQIRKSLERLMAARKVSKAGAKRGTEYSWGKGKAKASAGKTAGKKTRGRRKVRRKKAGRKKARRTRARAAKA